MTKTLGSRSISSQMPCLIASTKVTTPPRAGRFDLCSFLVAVDMPDYLDGLYQNYGLRPRGFTRGFTSCGGPKANRVSRMDDALFSKAGRWRSNTSAGQR